MFRLIFAVGVLYFAVVIDGQDMDKVALCIEKIQPTEDDIQSVMSLSEIPKSEGARCLMGCAMRELGMTNPDNSINVAGSKAVFEIMYADTLASQLETAFNECATETAGKPGMDNECTAAQTIAECLMPKAKPILEQAAAE